VRQAAILACCAAVPTVATLCFDLRWKLPAEFRQVKAAQASIHIRDYLWVDDRSHERYEISHIENAFSFDETHPDEDLIELRRVFRDYKKIVVYGEGAGSDRALRVARLLKKELGIKDIYLLEGGWATWPRN